MKTIGFFSVIRYVPDAFRKEFLNVGVLVAFPGVGSVKFRLHPEGIITKLRHFDKAFDPDIFDFFESNLTTMLSSEGTHEGTFYLSQERIASPESLRMLLRSFVGARMQFSEFYSTEFDTDNITQIEIDTFLDDLLSSYVTSHGVPETIKREQKPRTFQAELAKVTVKWERFKELAKNVLSLTPEEAERIRKNAPESKDKEQDS